MSRTAGWRWWLASVLVGRRPRTFRAVFVPVGTPRWKRWWYRFRPPSGPPMPPPRMPPIQKWMEPPDELGVAVPMQRRLAAGADAVVALTGCVAYTTGFQLGVAIRRRRDPPWMPFPPARYEPPEMSLDLGVRFADGRQSTSTGHRMHHQVRAYMEAYAAGQEPPEPTGPVIGMRGGGGGGRRWDTNFWVWPLPPEGPLTITCHWPAGEVPDGAVEVDGSAIRDAGGRSQKLWTD